MTSAGRSSPTCDSDPPYLPIERYGVIGNLRSVALISDQGSIDWCCFPNIGGGSVFAALLDAERGGRFVVRGEGPGRQRYLDRTNVVETSFTSGRGKVTVTDLMPLWGNIDGKGRSRARQEIHRLMRCGGGGTEVEVRWSPRPDYARARTRVEWEEGCWTVRWGEESLTLCGLDHGRVEDTPFGPEVTGRLRLQDGEEAVVVTKYRTADRGCSVDDTKAMLEQTVRSWRDWVHTPKDLSAPRWAGEWEPMVIRSELALKLLIHDDTGSIVAAPTTSLPEIVGGEDNWDYRFSWLRDASMTAQALLAVGHGREAVEYLEWIEKVSDPDRSAEWSPQIMYGVHGEQDLPEQELGHLDGYRCSRPVRIGNGAARQRQLEVYGEIMSTGYELLREGVELDYRLRRFLAVVADKACEVWTLPDSGLWERRGPERHYTYSKTMLWVALDRAVHMAEQYGLEGSVERWRRVGEEIAATTVREGYSAPRVAFVEHFGGETLDAANLRIPQLELLPYSDARVQGTIDRTITELQDRGLVYRTTESREAGEGAFTLCSFWLVQALALSGRVEEARKVLTTISGLASPLGLFAEMFDPRTGNHLGNFPQAFSHIGFINAVLYLLYAEGREVPVPAPIGSKEHRALLGRKHQEGVAIRSSSR